MRIVTVRRISQVFFLVVFLWFCVAATVGAEWWRLRGWPINWILSLDPLTALATTLATGTLFAPLLWSLVAVALTAFVGRFFCGWACPLGTLNQFVGWLSRFRPSSWAWRAARANPARADGADKADRAAIRLGRVLDNRYRPAQALKYGLLLFFLAGAALGTVQSGLLDPLPLVHRSVNLAAAPILDVFGLLSDEPRHYASAWLLGAIFLLVLGLNILIPRFFCRFVCPLGALFGTLARFSPWRIGKVPTGAGRCGDCRICEEHCEGACRPSGKFILSECVLCLNCLDRCPADRITFQARPSAGGEQHLPDPSRRAVLAIGAAGAAGLVAAPLWRTGAMGATGRNPELIRPPGSLDEERFLARCIRCGQCMRVCPSNIIQPALLQAGVQGIWTPAIDYRTSRSGCQQNCVACGNVCPTAAIRPLSLEEKQGLGDFAPRGPIRLGTAFVDRTRCLPWAMNRPCIVCQEVCPVSPKAIYTRTAFETVRDGLATLARADGSVLTLAGAVPGSMNLASGDYYLRPAGRPESESAQARRIVAVSGPALTLAGPSAGDQAPLKAGDKVEIVARLQRPMIDPSKCIGCGMCEHDCPVSGLRAIRVTSENETRSGPGRMLA
jgi:ferredoxin/polyferredoxin